MAFMGMLCSSLYAQELSRVPLPKEAYSASAKNITLVNQRKVQESFQSLSSVYLLDFANAVPKSIQPNLLETADKAVTEAGYVYYNNTATISTLLSLQPEALTVQLPFKGEMLTADLVKADLFGDNFQVSSNVPSSVEGVKTGVYYQGTLRGENAIVTFSFFENEFSALIISDEAENSIIEVGFMMTKDNTNGTHIVYSDDDLKLSFNQPCQSESMAQYQEAMEQLENAEPASEQEKVALKCVTYFWETQYNMFQHFGSTQSVTNFMTSLFNNFQIIYNNESIGSQLNQLYVWSTQDSYNNSLDAFSSGRSGFNANLATLFSRTGGGGVAWLNTLCQSGDYYRHGFCGSMGSSIPAFPNYSWSLNVTAHEVGHNLGSPHTHACSWTGGAIDGCGPQAGYDEGCTGPIPSSSVGGTVMSYCHLTSSGIKLTNGFGPQPGNLVRSRVNSCITLTCETDPGTPPCVSAFEPNETQSAATTVTSGATNSAAISTSTDVDYFKITTTGTTNNTFSLVGPSGVNYDLTIYNSGGTQIGAGTGSTATETVTLSNQAAGTYYIRVNGVSGTTSQTCYTIQATATPVASGCIAAFEPNETQAAAAAIVSGATNSAAISSSTDVDYFRITTTQTTNNVFNLVGPSGVDFDMAIYNSGGTQIGSGTSGSATETVTLNNQAAGTYYIRIYGYNGANSQSCYTIKATATATGASCGTAFEPNESISAAATISYGVSNSAAITTSSDNDYFRVVTTATSNSTFSLVGPSGVDFDMTIYNGSGSAIANGVGSTATETITINNMPAGTYYIRVFGYSGANSQSCYTLRVGASGTSVALVSEENRLTPYPNPTNDKLNLGGTYNGKLMNQLGQTVQVFTDASVLNLGELKAGVYLLQVEGSEEIYRVIKE